MRSQSTSNVEVRNTKSRKRTKKKDKSTDLNISSECDSNVPENDSKATESFKEQIAKHKRKRKGNKPKVEKRQKSGKDNVNGNEEQSDNELDNEEAYSKKLANTNIQQDEDKEDDEDVNRNGKNSSKEPSKRQIKKEKAEKRQTERQKASKLLLMKKALNYVSKWKYVRSEWKFEKLRQMWLIENLLDENSIPDDIFPIVLEYFEGCKGMAREQLLKKGMDVVRQAEDDEEIRDEIMESTFYKRARKLLQALPTET